MSSTFITTMTSRFPKFPKISVSRGRDELLLLEQRLALREKFAVIRSEAEKILRMTDDSSVAECAKRILMTED